MDKDKMIYDFHKDPKPVDPYLHGSRIDLNPIYKRIQELKEELKHHPNSLDLLNRLAKFYNITSQYNKTIEICNKILKSGEINKDVLNNLFYAYDKREDFDNALKVLKIYIENINLKKNPDLQKFSYYPDTERYFKPKIKIDLLVVLNKLPFNLFSEVIENNFNTSFRFSRIGWSERSFEAFSLILEQYPKDIDILNALIKKYLSIEQITKAKEFLDRALSIDKRNLTTRLLLGDYYRKMGKNKESEDEYKYIISASFSLDESNRIQLHDKGVGEIDTIILISVLVRLGILYNETGEYRHSITHLSKVLDFSRRMRTLSSGKNPSLAPIYHNLGIAHQALGSNKLALKAFKNGLKHDPMNIEVLVRLGESYYDMKKYNKALGILQRVVRIDSENHLSWHLLSKVYYELGEKSRALETIAKCLSLEPGFEPALKLQEELSRL